LNIQQNAKFGQKKLALSKTITNLFFPFLSRVNIFYSTGTVTMLTADVSRINYSVTQ